MKNLQELPQLKDSISYLYVEHAIIEQNDAAIVAIQKDGRTPIPIAAMTCLLLGPGTSVTHAAIRAICEKRMYGDLVRRTCRTFLCCRYRRDQKCEKSADTGKSLYGRRQASGSREKNVSGPFSPS